MEAYLDNSATTRCCKEATDKMVELLTMDYGNPSSLYGIGREAKKTIENTFQLIEKLAEYLAGEILLNYPLAANLHS